jgi:hypothetical protein
MLQSGSGVASQSGAAPYLPPSAIRQHPRLLPEITILVGRRFTASLKAATATCDPLLGYLHRPTPQCGGADPAHPPRAIDL